MRHTIYGTRSVSRAGKALRLRHRARLRVEELESRCLLTVLTPMQVRQAYGFDQVTFSGTNGPVVGDGSGQTIAIVDAYDNANIFTDVDTFDQRFGDTAGQNLLSQYGAASTFLTKATPQGQPPGNSGWGTEIALDVEWAHAIAPGAKILLVEARSASTSSLLSAVDYARKQTGVSVVSMSWGGGEFSGESSDDTYFSTLTGHTGVSFFAAAGDSGAGAEWPASSSHVVGVGGTALTLNSSGGYGSETTWSGSGGGISRYVSKPSYQSGESLSSTKRTVPDVAYDASTSSAVYVYDRGWYAVGGTSAGAPQWAALVAIADQGRKLAGAGTLDGYTQTLPALYGLASADFHDITSGSNGYSAGSGYDLVTGRGTPRAQLVIADLAAYGTTSPHLVLAASGTNSASTGTTGTVTGGTPRSGTPTTGTPSRGTPTGGGQTVGTPVSGTPTGGSGTGRARITQPVTIVTVPVPVSGSGTVTTPSAGSGLGLDAIAAALSATNNQPVAAVVQQPAIPLTAQPVQLTAGTLVIPSAQPISTSSTLQSGGGDTGALMSDPEPMATPAERQTPRPRAKPAPAAVPADPQQPNPDMDSSSAADWRQACTACFASDGSTLVPLGAGTSHEEQAELLPAAQPLAVLAGLAAVLSGSWSAPAEERERERRRVLGI
jgi:hypothetical protein